ncbi:MAG: tol-pal system-associated acyl-CoA thioesterase [Methylobacillus sp.]|nr:tol-pal system-associated acyl-CoA thioesterase [Methylobacillus sp.]
MSNKFVWPVRVYYEDTDGGGVVYHANYLNFMERARTEWLRALGFEQDALRVDPGILFVMREVRLKYKKPACFNDMLEVVTELTDAGRSLLQFRQTISRGDDVLTDAEVEVVCVDAGRFKPIAIPPSVREKITKVT